MQNEIVIVTTTDTKYLLNCFVAIFSIVKMADPMDIYKIFVLSTGLSQKESEKLEGLSLHGHIFVECIDISDIAKEFDLRGTDYFPVSIYYRLFIPLILPEYKKVLYLDADICVLRNLAELYNTDLEEYALGAVRDVPCEHLKIHDEKIGYLDCRKTFNSGVLLIDTEKFEKNQIRERCMSLLVEDYTREERLLIYPDNDALNIVLYEKYKILNDAWNFQVQHIWKMDEMFEEYKSRYIKISNQPYIVHYTGDCKPWTHPECPMADIFWKLAKEAAVYDEIVFNQLIYARELRDKIKCCEKFVFPYYQIPYGSKIAIYGAGMVGKAFYYLMQFSHYAEIMLWVDQNYKKLLPSFPVSSPELLLSQKEDYQYIIIAIEKKEIASGILKELCYNGITKEKIIWTNY